MLYHLLLLLLGFSVRAQEEHKDQECLDACYESVGYATFVGDDPDVYYYGLCQNPPKVLSIYACGKTYCSDLEVEAGAKLLAEYCQEYGPDLELLPIDDFAANLTPAAIQSLQVVDYDDVLAATDPYASAFLISQSFFEAMDKTVVTWLFEMWTNTTYGFALYGFWGGILVIGMINNALSWWFSRSSKHVDSENLSYSVYRTPRIVKATRAGIDRYLVVPFLIGSHHRRLLYGFKIPTRIVSIVVFMYWALSLILCAVNYDAYYGNLYWTNISPQAWRYVADRTGIMAFSNLPWLWMFAGRNNIFIWATGWQFSTFNIFHRNIARAATLQAVVHSIAFTVIYFQDGKEEYYEAFDEAWFTLGVVAMVLMALIIVTSSIMLRKKSYELFLILHILMSVATIVALFYHVSDFDGEYNPYLWPLVAIWGFDRFLRLVRLGYCNIRIKTSKDLIEVTNAVVTYNSADDVISLEITPGSSALKPRAGQYFFIYQPFSWKGWENHPFTLGAWSSQIASSADTPSRSGSDIPVDTGMKYAVSSAHQGLEARSNSSTSTSHSQSRLLFWIRPFDGWTRQIRNKCQASADGKFHARFLLEGPYGHSASMHNYEAVLLIGGGTGVSAVNPYVQEHVQRIKAGEPTRTRTMHLIFSARQAGFVRQVYDTTLRSAQQSNVSFELFATGNKSQVDDKDGANPTSPISPLSTDSVNVELNTNPWHIQYHRPDVTASILDFARKNNATGNTEIAVMVCGPAAMADEARSAVMATLRKGFGVKYFEEAFGW